MGIDTPGTGAVRSKSDDHPLRSGMAKAAGLAGDAPIGQGLSRAGDNVVAIRGAPDPPAISGGNHGDGTQATGDCSISGIDRFRGCVNGESLRRGRLECFNHGTGERVMAERKTAAAAIGVYQLFKGGSSGNGGRVRQIPCLIVAPQLTVWQGSNQPEELKPWDATTPG